MFLAKFYEDLYEGEDDYVGEDVMMGAECEDEETEQSVKIKEFTTEEIQSVIDRLKKGKAKDSNGIRAEQLKLCSDETKEEIRTLFNEIAQQDEFTPKSWRKIRIQVIYKKGDRENAGNYRPMCGFPILYKLFATVLYARLAPGLHRIQPPFRQGFGPTTDAKITSWCTECWSNDVVRGVYHYTSARSTSQKHLTASNIQRCGSR